MRGFGGFVVVWCVFFLGGVWEWNGITRWHMRWDDEGLGFSFDFDWFGFHFRLDFFWLEMFCIGRFVFSCLLLFDRMESWIWGMVDFSWG